MIFKIRCSAIGKIMGVRGLGKTGMSYCETWLKEQVYNRKNEFTSKYTDKGITMEDNSLDFIADELDLGLLIKNETHFEEDFIIGTPDIVLLHSIIDVKNSWDCFTFPLFDKDIPNKDYWWQLQGYIAITGKSKAQLVYTLMDTPRHLIDKEFNYNNPMDLDYDEFEKKYLYEGIVEPKYRIKIFDITRDDDAIKQIESRVIECREYIKTLN